MGKSAPKARLKEELENFTDQMGCRLEEKRKEGYKGWDIDSFTALNIPRRLHDKALSVLMGGKNGEDIAPVDLVDIANFAMILYYRLKNN